MRAWGSEIQTQLDGHKVGVRDTMTVTVKDRANPATTYTYHFWSDIVDRDINVLDPFTETEEVRNYKAAGANIAIDALNVAAGLIVHPIDIEMSQIDTSVAEMLQVYDPKLAPVEIHRVYLNPITNLQLDYAVPKFIGFIDEVEEEEAPVGETGKITVRCVSHTQELLRSNSEKRSDQSQRKRSATDSFYRHTADVGTWTIWWGQKQE